MPKYHTEETKRKISNSLKGVYTSDTYGTIHIWLIKNFGKANKCENPKCDFNSKTFDYALIKGKTYKRKRENFIMLCRSCHKKYDMNKQTKDKIKKKMKLIAKKYKKEQLVLDAINYISTDIFNAVEIWNTIQDMNYRTAGNYIQISIVTIRKYLNKHCKRLDWQQYRKEIK